MTNISKLFKACTQLLSDDNSTVDVKSEHVLSWNFTVDDTTVDFSLSYSQAVVRHISLVGIKIVSFAAKNWHFTVRLILHLLTALQMSLPVSPYDPR